MANFTKPLRRFLRSDRKETVLTSDNTVCLRYVRSYTKGRSCVLDAVSYFSTPMLQTPTSWHSLVPRVRVPVLDANPGRGTSAMPTCSISRSFTVRSHSIRSTTARYRSSKLLGAVVPRLASKGGLATLPKCGCPTLRDFRRVGTKVHGFLALVAPLPHSTVIHVLDLTRRKSQPDRVPTQRIATGFFQTASPTRLQEASRRRRFWA